MNVTIASMMATASQKCQGAVIRPTSAPKFMPKKPVKNVSGRNSVANTVSRVIRRFRRLDTVDRYTSMAVLNRSRSESTVSDCRTRWS